MGYWIRTGGRHMVIEGHFLIMLVDSNSWPWLFDSFASGDSVDSSPASPANRYRDLDSQNRVRILSVAMPP